MAHLDLPGPTRAIWLKSIESCSNSGYLV